MRQTAPPQACPLHRTHVTPVQSPCSLALSKCVIISYSTWRSLPHFWDDCRRADHEGGRDPSQLGSPRVQVLRASWPIARLIRTGLGVSASFLREQIGTARDAGVTGDLIARMDSSYYNGKAIKACRDLGACFLVTMRMDPKVRRRIAGIPDDAWVRIRYPHAIWDDEEKAWISDAEVAETGYTAFTSDKARTITARMIVRRVRRLNPKAGRLRQRVPPRHPDQMQRNRHSTQPDQMPHHGSSPNHTRSRPAQAAWRLGVPPPARAGFAGAADGRDAERSASSVFRGTIRSTEPSPP